MSILNNEALKALESLDINNEVTKALGSLDIDPRSNGPRPEAPAPPPAPPVPPAPPRPPAPPANTAALSELLTRLDAIVQNVSHINEATNSIRSMIDSEPDCEDIVKIGVSGIVDVIRQREETNRKAIYLLEQMYSDFTPAGKSSKSKGQSIADKFMGLGIDIDDVINTLPPNEKIHFIRELLEMDN